jgi:hypothetical protein
VLASLATAIGAYPTLRAGTIALVKDAREFGGIVSTVFIEKSNAKQEQTFRVERRTKTPGKIARVITTLDELNETPAKPERRRLELAMVRMELESIERDLKAEEIDFLHANLVFENLPPLRPEPNKGRVLDSRKVALPPRRHDQLDMPYERFDANARPVEPRRGPVVYEKAIFVPRVGFRLAENQRREIEPPLEH